MYLYMCHAVEEVPVHRHLQFLTVESCHGLKRIPTMVNLEDLTVESCDTLETIADQPALVRAELSNCDVLQTLFECDTLVELYLDGCPLFEAVPVYPRLRVLDIQNCENIHTIPGMNTLDQIGLKNVGVRELVGFQALNLLVGANLKNLERVESLPNIEVIKIKNAPRLLVLPPLANEHGTLKLVGCPWVSVPENLNYERNICCLVKIQRQLKVAILRRRYAKFMTLKKKTPLPDDICRLISRM